MSLAAPSMISNSQLISLTALLKQTLELRGLDADALLRQAGIAPDEIHQANARVSSQKMDVLWQRVMEASDGDLSIALEHGQRFNPVNLHVLGFGLYASATLSEASERLSRAVRIIVNSLRVDCIRSPREFRIEIETLYPAVAPQKQVVFHTVVLSLWRSMSHPHLKPLQLRLTVPEPTNPQVCARLEAFFGCPVLYSQRRSSISLSLDEANAPLPMANPDLANRGDALVQSYLAELDRSEIVAAVISKIGEGSFDKVSVARKLGISGSTLQRRLALENLSFSELLNRIRRDLAGDYLRSGRYAIKEVTYLLGYTDPASFCRAFRSWYGVSPEAFKSGMLPG